MSGRQASAALIVSVPLIHPRFNPERLPSRQKPRTNATFIFRHNGASPTCHEIAFYCKASSDIKGRTKSYAILK